MQEYPTHILEIVCLHLVPRILWIHRFFDIPIPFVHEFCLLNTKQSIFCTSQSVFNLKSVICDQTHKYWKCHSVYMYRNIVHQLTVTLAK